MRKKDKPWISNITLIYLWPQIIILQMLNIWLNVYILKCILAVCSTESECICILFVYSVWIYSVCSTVYKYILSVLQVRSSRSPSPHCPQLRIRKSVFGISDWTSQDPLSGGRGRVQEGDGRPWPRSDHQTPELLRYPPQFVLYVTGAWGQETYPPPRVSLTKGIWLSPSCN